MSRLVPGTLFGQTLLILLAGLGVTLLAGSWIYSSARQEAVRAVGGLAAGQRIANLARLVEEAPADWGERLVAGSSDPAFQVSLSSERPVLTTEADEAGIADIISEFLRQQMPSREVLVTVLGVEDMPPGLAPHHSRGGGPGFGPGMHGPMMQGPMMRAAMSWRGLQAAVRLADDRWLRFSTVLPDTGPDFASAPHCPPRHDRDDCGSDRMGRAPHDGTLGRTSPPLPNGSAVMSTPRHCRDRFGRDTRRLTRVQHHADAIAAADREPDLNAGGNLA